MNNKIKKIKIKKLLFLLDQAKMNYQLYMSNEKIFLHTIEIQSINKRILKLIEELNFKEDKELRNPYFDLIEHLNEWLSIWNQEKNIQRPNDNDKFVFDSCKKYPKEIEGLLTLHLEKLNRIKQY